MKKVAFIPLIFLLQTACLEVQERPVNYGPEVQLAEIYKVMQEPLIASAKKEINKNEGTETTLIAFLPSGDSLVINKETRIVDSREDKNTYWHYITKVFLTDYVNGKSSSREGEPIYMNVAKAKDFADADQGVFNLSSFAPAKIKTTFHQLKYEDQMLEPPTKVKNKSNCLAIPDCKIRARKITLVQVNWIDTGAERHDLELVISPDVPYHGHLYRQCDSFMKSFGARVAPITVCNALTDFDFGVPW